MASRAADRWTTRKLTRLTFSALYKAMDRDPQILGSEPVEEGLIIRFDDGTSGLFPAALLYAILPQAQNLQMVDVSQSPPISKNDVRAA